MSILVSMSTWLTPTSLFLFLNLMIGTIFLISRSRQPHLRPPHLTRASSLLNTVKSINFSLYNFSHPESETIFSQSGYNNPVDPPPLARAPSLVDRFKSINFSAYKFPTYNPDTEFEKPGYPAYPAQLVSAPSLIDRVKSINFSNYKFTQYNPEDTDLPEPDHDHDHDHDDSVGSPRLTRAPSLLQRVKSIKLSSFYRSENIQEIDYHPQHMESDSNGYESNRSFSPDTVTAGEHKPTRSKSENATSGRKAAERKIKKSSSEKSRINRFSEEDVEVIEGNRPQTSRLQKTVSIGDGDDGVDAKADDFINKFRQQLKLQRLDSIIRYKEMLKRK